MLRIAVTASFLILAVIIIALAFRENIQGRTGDLLLNLGSEIIGIAITVAIVEWLFERKQSRNESRRMAWRILHSIDHAVWVWQGGSRGFRMDELLGLLDAVTNDDPLPEYTENLFLNIGSAAQDTLRYESDILQSDSSLQTALECLSPLSRIRDQKNLLTNREVVNNLNSAVLHLAEVLQLDTVIQQPEAISKIRQPSAEMQEWRYYGKNL